MDSTELVLQIATLVLAFIESRRSYLESRRTQRHDHEQRMAELNAARHVLEDAIVMTRAYLADRKAGKKADRAEERQLALTWNKVGLAVKAIGGKGSKELSERCLGKASYWTDPKRWEKKGQKKLDIGLESVERDMRKHLEGVNQ